ncbi:MAG: hypothetical protein JSR91_00570 [Proteobacteria bacterium]|nr:hypothetical protein [Pseudomonadota bacterium]
MFQQFIRRLSGAISPAAAEHYCEECLSNLPVIARSRFKENEPFLIILKDARFTENLLTFLRRACEKCFSPNRRPAQLVNLRREIIARANDLFIAEVYLAMTSAERTLVSERLFTQRTKAENDAHFLASQAFNYAATLVLRDLGREYFQDMRPGDWYEAYLAAGRTLAQTSLGTLVNRSSAGSGTAAALLPTLEARTKEIRGIALSGRNLSSQARLAFAGGS